VIKSDDYLYCFPGKQAKGKKSKSNCLFIITGYNTWQSSTASHWKKLCQLVMFTGENQFNIVDNACWAVDGCYKSKMYEYSYKYTI